MLLRRKDDAEPAGRCDGILYAAAPVSFHEAQDLAGFSFRQGTAQTRAELAEGQARAQGIFLVIGQQELHGPAFKLLIRLPMDIAGRRLVQNALFRKAGCSCVQHGGICSQGGLHVGLTGKGFRLVEQIIAEPFVESAAVLRFQAIQHGVLKAAVLAGIGVQHFAAAYGAHWGKGPQDKSIPCLDDDFIPFQPQLHKAFLSGKNRLHAQGDGPDHDFLRPDEEAQAVPHLNRTARSLQAGNLGVDHSRRRQIAGSAQYVAAANFISSYVG